MNYSSLEDAYGTSFGGRVPISETTARKEPITSSAHSSLEEKSKASIEKNKDLIASVTGSLPLDTSPVTENFKVYAEKPAVVHRQEVRERFTQPVGLDPNDDKLSRILRLIEQNKTGYERPATQDMVLYVFTGIMFLFTFDTFVTLGKTMGRRN